MSPSFGVFNFTSYCRASLTKKIFGLQRKRRTLLNLKILQGKFHGSGCCCNKLKKLFSFLFSVKKLLKARTTRWQCCHQASWKKSGHWAGAWKTGLCCHNTLLCLFTNDMVSNLNPQVLFFKLKHFSEISAFGFFIINRTLFTSFLGTTFTITSNPDNNRHFCLNSEFNKAHQTHR